MYKTPPATIMTRRRRREEADKCEVASEQMPRAAPLLEVIPPRATRSNITTCDNVVKKSSPKTSPSAASKTSVKSKKSTISSAARRKQLELEAAQAKAKIQMDLIDKQLEANLAQVDAEEQHANSGSQCSEALLDEQLRSHVEDWLDQGQEELPTCTAKHTVPTELNPNSLPTQQPAGDSMMQLAQTLKDLMSQSSAQKDERLLSRLGTPRDLPNFSGDCVEWLHFKSAYNDSTRICRFSDAENLWRLRKALRGDAKDTVTDLLIGNTPPAAIMEALELRFGRSELIIQNLTTQLKKLPALPSCYQQDIINFSIKINNCVATIKALNQDDYLRSPELATAAIAKLPSTLIGKWTDYAYNKLKEGTKSKLELLATFLKQEADMIAVVGVQQSRDKTSVEMPKKKNEENNKFHNRPVFTTTCTEQDKNTQICKFCKKVNHTLTECRLFKRAMRKDKWRFVKLHGLCYCCLTKHQDTNSCSAPVCDVDECGLAHHRLLHWKRPAQAAEVAHTATQQEPEQSTIAQVTSPHSGVMLKVVAVTLRGPSGSVSTYALLDDAASVSIIDSELADSLGLQCEKSSDIKFIDAFGLEVYQSDAPTVSAKINNQHVKDISYDIKLRKVCKFNLPVQDLSAVKNINSNKLLHVKDKVCSNRVIPKLLIGEDNYYLIAPLKVIHGDMYNPYATYCRLGWSIHGYCGRTHSHVSRNVFYLSHDPYDSLKKCCELDNLMHEYFTLDSIGINSTLRRDNTAHLRAIQILDDTSRLTDEQWEVGLPLKQDSCIMPAESYDNALSRLCTLLKRFQKDESYANKYKIEIEKLFSNGYARKLTEHEIACTDRVWYLPHFGVHNPNKPGKLRLVYDAAAKVRGTSLNDCLLTGPDLYNSLLGIMFRFRENKIVIIGDIRDMFLRIKIRTEDQNLLRFLWQEAADKPLSVCVMQSLIFGATCSPFIAQYIKNKNALKYEDLYPEAVQVILKNHYMDDCLYSTNDENNAIKLINEITEIHKKGGFEIRGWSSNSKEVLQHIPAESLAQSAVQFKDGSMNTTERTLGLMWHPADDTFGFKVSLNKYPEEIINGIQPPTKAQMLSIIMSIYDIHGFLCPFTIKSKIILQKVHRSGIDWRCRIRPEERADFMRWLDELKQLQSLRIPRCFLYAGNWTQCYTVSTIEPDADVEGIVDTQMHIFCDASTKAYAAVIYWRLTRVDGQVIVCFAAGKSRVTPLRPVSIPRLELQGALLAARLAHTVQGEHKDFKANKRIFWTDSSTVLQWIRSDPRSFKPYVAHRLGEIDELTKLNEWRYVPSRLNVADVATKDNTPPLKYEDEWFQGPSYLRQPESSWPKDLKGTAVAAGADWEVRAVNVVMSHNIDYCLPNEDNFSSWLRLVRSTATVLLFIRKCQRKATYIDVDLMKEAEELLIKKCQDMSFAREIDCLSQKKDIPANSRILNLTPYLDDSGILRVDGRVDKVSGVPLITTRPVILDGKHKISRLLVSYHHQRAHHGSNELVVNELRQRYWIVNLRPTVRIVAARCLPCRYRRAAPQPQRMADLPAARLQHHRRPFSYTGVDFFGPMEVTVGRRRLKRYGMLFTCLTIRAVHIEVTESLTTDAAIMAIRRMVARRGTPSVIYSDNGTNLRGADTELKQSLAELNFDRIREDGTVRGIKWCFIPPGAPEMGGAWERLIRSVKTALRVVLKERAPYPETLNTLLAEVEALINSRPITHVSSDPNYPEALTPCHFLIGTSSFGPLIGKYSEVDLCLRRQWRVAQRLADMFWARWLKEYLPTLLPRQKWTKEERSLMVGDYVILVEPNPDRGTWRHGVVSATHAGYDGRVRVVDVRTRTGLLRRPVTRVALLSMASESSAD